MEMLPKVPDWKSKEVTLRGHPINEPMYLFYHNTLNCIEYIFGNPLFADHMDFCPAHLYQDAEWTIHVYGKWMASNVAWDMQVCSISYISQFFLRH